MKFERAFVSEIVAVDVVRNGEGEKRAGFRIDPLSLSSKVPLKEKEDGSFEVGTGKLKASEINHGNIVFESGNTGIRFSYAEQTTVVSLGALRKLRFPVNGSNNPKVDDAARAVLAAIALCAGVLASEMGTSLRSRCSLWPVAEREWELLERPGQETRKFSLSGEQAVRLLNEAVAHAQQAGLSWMEEKLVLTPTPELAKLVRQSQELAAKEKSEGGAE